MGVWMAQVEGTCFPFIFSTAVAASAAEANCTNPKPRDLPSRSSTLAASTRPILPKLFCNVAVVQSKGRLRTMSRCRFSLAASAVVPPPTTAAGFALAATAATASSPLACRAIAISAKDAGDQESGRTHPGFEHRSERATEEFATTQPLHRGASVFVCGKKDFGDPAIEHPHAASLHRAGLDAAVAAAMRQAACKAQGHGVPFCIA